MNRIHKIVLDIHDFLEANANPELVKKYSRYFKDGYKGFGVDYKITGPFKDEIIKMNSNLSFDDYLLLADQLITLPSYEEKMMAVSFIIYFKKKINTVAMEHFELWLEKYVDNWATCDTLCGELVSIYLLTQKDQLSPMNKWRVSTSKWQRRAVPVSLIKPMKKSNDIQPYLEFIDPMMLDPEREVHQGLGWFLRECWKVNPVPVENLLLKWKDKSARLIFQYACEKMTKEQKERFKKVKI